MEFSKPWDYYKDQLTGLDNRYALMEYLELESSHRLTVFVLDVDNFSACNRMYGYFVSDAILKKVASYLERLRLRHMRLFRFDGDRFVFTTKEFMNFREIEEFAKGIISFFEQTEIDVEYNDEEILHKISVSIGAAMGSGVITLNHAEMVVSEARENSKSSFKLFTAKSNYSKKQQEDIYWINKIKKAIEDEKLVAYYQPIKNMHTDNIEKYEALARINDDSIVVSPIRFMEAARQTGTFSLITRTIIRHTFARFQNTRYSFSINITASDIRLGYLEEFLTNHVKKYNIEPSRVVLELLEDIVTLTEGDMMEQIKRLRKLGFQIAIDDFGMENSNFSRLLELHPDYLKIDGAFIKNILTDEKSQIIVDAIIDICKKSGIQIIAEYVSDEAIYNYLKERDVDYAQGYYIGEPVEQIED